MNAVSLHHIEQRLLADSSALGKELVLRISPEGSREVINIADKGRGKKKSTFF